MGDSELGRYMVEKLSLYLLRHAFIWQTQKLAEIRAKLFSLKAKLDSDSEHYVPLLEEFVTVTCEYERYRSSAIES